VRPSLCTDHAPVVAMNLRAISGHRRRKTNALIRRQIAGACPQCIALNRGATP